MAGSGEWGQNGGRVGRAQQSRNCGPRHNSGFMWRALGSYRVCESRGSRRGYGRSGLQGGGLKRVYWGLETQGRERLRSRWDRRGDCLRVKAERREEVRVNAKSLTEGVIQ